MRLPDPQRSRVVLIGTSEYDDEKLPDLPAVGRTVSDLATALIDPVYRLVPENHCTVLADRGRHPPDRPSAEAGSQAG